VGHERQLVRRVELACPGGDRWEARDQAAGRRLLIQHLRPAVVGKHALDEILAQGHVIQPALFLHGQQREPLLERPGKHPHAVALGHAVLVVDLDAEQARGGRILFIRLYSNAKKVRA